MEPDATLSSLVSPADLELRITTPWGQGGRSLELVLHSASGKVGFHHRRIAGKTIHAPERFQKQLYEQLEALHGGLDVEGGVVVRDEVLAELTSIGHDLFQMLFPREMRNIYREIRDKVETLVITSDEPWIPWEILRPAELPDDDFLCMTFQMGRWLTGDVPLALGKRVRRLLCVEPGEGEGPGLAGASEERRFLRAFCREIPGLDGTFPRGALHHDIAQQIGTGGFDLIHFAGHGLYDAGRPAESRVQLPDRPFRVRHLAPEVETKLRHERPVVFFNACQGGRFDHSLSGLDGWAPRWVRRCGCSAFLAPFWSVNDSRARRFAELFYRAIYQGRALGEAVRGARHRLRQEQPGEMGWLAYSFYGHPNAWVVLGDHQPSLAGGASSSFVMSQPIPEPSTTPDRRHPAARSPATPGIYPVVGPGQLPGSDRSARPGQGPLLGAPRSVSALLRRLGLAGSAMVVVVALWLALGEGGWRIAERGGGSAPAGLAASEPEIELASPADGLAGGPADSGTVDGVDHDATDGGSPGAGRERPDAAIPRPPGSALPLSARIPGKVVILVLDRDSHRFDFAVAEALRGLLAEQVAGRSFVAPRLGEVEPVESLLAGDYSALPSDGRAPWGAEHLLVATVHRKPLPQPNAIFEGVTLTLATQWIDSASRSMTWRTQQTQNGLGISIDVALRQAAERCLREITGMLNKGESHEPK